MCGGDTASSFKLYSKNTCFSTSLFLLLSERKTSKSSKISFCQPPLHNYHSLKYLVEVSGQTKQMRTGFRNSWFPMHHLSSLGNHCRCTSVTQMWTNHSTEFNSLTNNRQTTCSPQLKTDSQPTPIRKAWKWMRWLCSSTRWKTSKQAEQYIQPHWQRPAAISSPPMEFDSVLQPVACTSHFNSIQE